MMRTLTKIEFTGDQLVIKYTDDTDKLVSERAILVKWSDHPPIVKVVRAFQEVIATYFLTENHNLAQLPAESLEELFRQLLKDPSPPTTPGQGC